MSSADSIEQKYHDRFLRIVLCFVAPSCIWVIGIQLKPSVFALPDTTSGGSVFLLLLLVGVSLFFTRAILEGKERFERLSKEKANPQSMPVPMKPMRMANMAATAEIVKETPIIDYECENCGSNDIAFDALATFDSEKQEFRLLDAFPDAAPPICNDCGSEDYKTITIRRKNKESAS